MLSNLKNIIKSPSSKKQFDEGIQEASEVMEPMAAGNKQISILKHEIYRKCKEFGEIEVAGVELTIRNVSASTIATAIFEAIFYDIEGNIIDTVEHKEIELHPYMKSRTFNITSSRLVSNKVKSYNVRLVRATMPPSPAAIGNDKIKVLKHQLRKISVREIFYERNELPAGVEIAIRNVSASTIATAIFEAIFYDIEGNIIDTVEHKEIELKPNNSRAVIILSSLPPIRRDEVKGYSIRLVKTTTADIEKVQFRAHQVITTESGEEVRGVVKNISEAKTDAAIIVTFFDTYNTNKESIGTKIVILRNIEADSIRRFQFLFKPQEGDIVKTCTFNIGELV